MSRRISAIRSSLCNIAYVVGSTLGIKVVFGSSPKTDGKTVFLPDLPLDIEKNVPKPYKSAEQCIRILKGDVVHEGEHVNSTDFDDPDCKAVMEEGGFPASLLNSVEDIRIERKSAERFAGARMILADSVEAAVDCGLVKSNFDSEGEVFGMYVNTYGSIHLNGQDALRPLHQRYREKCHELLGDFGLTRIDAYLSTKLRGMRTTQDALKATEDLIRILKEVDEEEQKQQQQQQQPQSSPANGNGQDSPGNGAPDPSGSQAGGGSNPPNQPTGQDSGSGQDDQQAGNTPDPGQGTGKGTGAARILGDKTAKPTPVVDYKTAVEAIANAPGVKAPPRYPIPLSTVEDLTQYTIVRDDLRSEASVLRSRIVNHILSQQHEDVELASSGKLHRRRMVRLSLGDTRVFARKCEDPELNTALSILIDASGSMKGSRGVEAQKMMVLMGEATSRLDVSVEILGVDSGTEHVFAIKPFGVPYEASRGRLGGYLEAAGGGTELGHGLIQAAYRLGERPERRKVLFALTDGDTSDRELTQVAVDLIAREGIEVVAFGIESTSVAQYFPRHIIVDSASNLAFEVLRALREKLRHAA